MKRVFRSVEVDDEHEPMLKVSLVEREPKPQGIPIVDLRRISKKTHAELTELEEGYNYADAFTRARAEHKLEMIGRQMKNLRVLMDDVIDETKLCNELNKVACNFVKKPGHMYHLYERPSGQKYFGMLSPQEWGKPPHNYLGSYRFEADRSWTPADQEQNKYEGINYLRNVFSNTSGLPALSSNVI